MNITCSEYELGLMCDHVGLARLVFTSAQLGLV